MFSSRLHADLAENPFSRALAARRAEGKAIVDLTETNPTRVGLAVDAETIREAILAADLAVYEPSARGALPAREAVAAYYADRGVAVSPEQIVLTASTSEAYSLVMKLMLDPGDVVLVPRPSYPLFEHLAALEGVGTAGYPLVYTPSQGWRLDGDAMDAVITPRTRAVIVVSPHNPTGSFLKPSEGERLAVTCARRGMAMIVDDVFHDHPSATFEGPAAEPVRGGPALTFVLSGLSKVAGLPQLKLGWIVVTGLELLAREALHRLEFIADAYLSVGSPVQAAAPRLLAGRHEFRMKVGARVDSNETYLREAVRGRPLRLREREGGWSAVLDLPPGADEEAFVLGLLTEDGVLLHPGYFYDIEENGVVVASLLPPPEDFRRGVGVLCGRLPGSRISR